MTTIAPRLVYGRVFEGFFAHGLKGRVTPQLRERLLKELGVDLEGSLAPTYPLATWERAVVITADALYPGVALSESLPLLGEALTNGFFATAIGAVARAGMRLMGPQFAVRRLEDALRSANNYSEISVIERGTRHASVIINEPENIRELMRGSMRQALTVSGATSVRCVVESVEHERAVLDITWDE